MTCDNGPAVRHLMLLFAIIAVVWSGLCADQAEAHENAVGHASASAAASHGDEDKGQSGQGGDQHICHHHCPNAPAPRAPESVQRAIFTKQPVFGTIISALRPTGRAPPLDPPIS